jgi:Transglutaminase-like superfamily
VRLVRFVVTLPAGGEIKAIPFNGAPSATLSSAGTYTWSMENLPPIEREPQSPGLLTIVPWVGVSVLGAGNRPALSWPEVAKQLAELNEGQSEPNDALTAKAKTLVEGASTELDKIRAIGRFTQQVNYVSVQINLAKGGGYRPHPAAQVFQKLYGDCKDKANLTRAMLKAVGITAYPVAIYAGDRTHVNQEWPSLGAFNHAISAIRVGPEIQTPAVLDHSTLGRLLFFDPTDPNVPVGYLPSHEHASLALIGVANGGDLVRVPAAPASAGTRLRQVEAILKADGSISGSFVEKFTGESFAEFVGQFRATSKAEYSRMVERWIVHSIPGAAVSGVEFLEQGGEFALRGQFSAPRYAQIPQTKMLIFRAAPLRHGDSLRLTEKSRKYPVVMDADALEETIRISLPEGYKIDEVPETIHIESPFGNYDAEWEGRSGTLVFSRKIELQAQNVAAAQYGKLRSFLDVVYGSAETPVVLVK